MVRSLADRTFQLRLTVGLFAARDGAATGLNSMGFEVDVEIPPEVEIPDAPDIGRLAESALSGLADNCHCQQRECEAAGFTWMQGDPINGGDDWHCTCVFCPAGYGDEDVHDRHECEALGCEWEECRSDICTDFGEDCCAPDDEPRGCSLAGYEVQDDWVGSSGWPSCVREYGQESVYQCCSTSSSAGSCKEGFHTCHECQDHSKSGTWCDKDHDCYCDEGYCLDGAQLEGRGERPQAERSW